MLFLKLRRSYEQIKLALSGFLRLCAAGSAEHWACRFTNVGAQCELTECRRDGGALDDQKYLRQDTCLHAAQFSATAFLLFAAEVGLFLGEYTAALWLHYSCLSHLIQSSLSAWGSILWQSNLRLGSFNVCENLSPIFSLTRITSVPVPYHNATRV